MCVPRAGLPLTLAAVGILAVAGLVAQRGSAARAYTQDDPGFPELLCTCGMPESMHGPLEHAFDPAPDRAPENPVGKTYGGDRAVSAHDLRRYGMSDREIRRAQQRGSRASEAPLGLDRHPFVSYALAREMLDDLGWAGLSSRRGPKNGSRSTSFSVPGKPGKAVHPWFTFSDWQSSDHTDKAAARVLSGIVGFDVARRYAELGVDPWFWDDEIEGHILHAYGMPPAYPQSGPNIGRRPYSGSGNMGSLNEADAVREALAILDEHPRRVAAAYQAFLRAKGIRAKAWSGMSSGAKATATALFFDNARIARALLKGM